MPLRVFRGPFQPDLEDAFIARLKEEPPGFDRRLAVVTPSRRLADRLQRLLCLERGLSLLNIRFHTFFSLAGEAVEERGLGDRTLVGDGLFHDMIVDGLLRGKTKSLSRGLSAAYRQSLRDLVDAGVEPDSFQEHFDDLLQDADKRKLQALFAHQVSYVEALERLGVVTPSGLARLAARAVEDGTASSLERYSRFVYYGFYDLTGVQTDFFSAVAGAYPTEIFFPYRKEHPAFAFAKRFYDLKLQGRSGPEGPPKAEGLPDCLFVPGKRALLKDPGFLKLVNVSGTRDEAWAAAKEALELHERRGIAFGRIGIVARALEPYRAALTQALRQNAVPFSTDAGEPLLRHPIAKLSLSLLSLRKLDFPSEAVLDIVGSPFFLPRSAADNWRRLIERLGIHSGWLQWVGKLSPWAKKDFELYAQAVSEGREGFVIPKEDSAGLWRLLEGLRSRLDPGRRASWEDHCAGAKAVLGEVFAGEGPAWEKTLELLDELKVFALVFPEASWGGFLEVLEEKFRRASLPGGEQNQGVRVMDAMDARGDSFDALILVGLTDGFFPRQVREDPLLPDSIRARLRHPAGYWIAPKLEGYDEEKLLFHLLVSSARVRLVCIYQRSDDEGRARIPSAYLRELCRACGLDLETAPHKRVARQPLMKLRELAPDFLSPKEVNLLLVQGKPFGGDFDECLARVGELKAAGEPGGLDGVIGPRAKLPESLSPTALDSFSACPFQFFASRILGLRKASEPSDRGELSAKVRGTIYHSILEGFYGELHESGFWRRPGGSWDKTLQKHIGSVFHEFGWKELGLYPLLWESTRRRMSFHLQRFVERDVFDIRDTGLLPVEFERELKAVIDGRKFRGSPDRIDRDGRGKFRVVDYKSSWSRSRGPLEKKVLSMQAHQPPLYLELAGEEGTPVGAFYHVIEESPELTGNPSVQGFTAGAWRLSRKAILGNVGRFLKQMERGEFHIAPDDERGGVCGFCDFAWLCRKAHPATRRRAEQSKLRAAFDAAHKTS